MIIASDNIEGLDEVIAKHIGETLHKHYPGYLWSVHVDGNNGIAQVLNLNLSGRWGFLMHLKDLDHPEYKAVIRAGGEILERYRVKRGSMDAAQIQQLQKDNVGSIIVDAS